jgi:2-polyprenyl-3-methyl-5-hydroxy-6-metoxy-1,4-benzoquinol methylase
MNTDNTDTYALGRSEAETQRLILQHRIYGPITRRCFEAAGIGAGMTVLDIGSGAGDVALLLADLVGPRGRVVGVDMNAAILDTARARAASAGFANVTFIAGEAGEAAGETRFDAVTGRYVLMYVPDPVALLRRLAGLLRPGGIVAFQEMDINNPPGSFPPTPAMSALSKWLVPPETLPIPDVRIGMKLLRLFREAGLPTPELRMEAPVGGGPDWPGYEYLAATLRSLAPMIRKMSGGYDVEADVGIDTLAERMRTEITAVDGVQMLAPIVGAWSRKA